MENWLNQEELFVTRADGGHFDVSAVAAALPEAVGAGGFVLQDEFVPELHLVFRSAQEREAARVQRHSDPRGTLPYVLIVRLLPEQVSINQFCGPDYAEYSRGLLTWLTTHHACRVRNEAGVDLTSTP